MIDKTPYYSPTEAPKNLFLVKSVSGESYDYKNKIQIEITEKSTINYLDGSPASLNSSFLKKGKNHRFEKNEQGGGHSKKEVIVDAVVFDSIDDFVKFVEEASKYTPGDKNFKFGFQSVIVGKDNMGYNVINIYDGFNE